MFKRVKPLETVRGYIGQFPHCDARILHAPGDCEFCDRHPEWQALRFAWTIAFTGYAPEDKELPDPATYARGETINRWQGNVATPKTEK